MSGKNPNKAIYDCMNSWGFDQPFISIEINSPAIKAIFKVVTEETLLSFRDVTNSEITGNHGIGCLGNCLLDDDKCCSVDNKSD